MALIFFNYNKIYITKLTILTIFKCADQCHEEYLHFYVNVYQIIFVYVLFSKFLNEYIFLNKYCNVKNPGFQSGRQDR